ncbi:MAG: hypothetical protein Q8J97_08545, partial [Flavobacteriaceae bacterium]|nr:hypothetical protein [Flavobacteriaceae bacterium]
QCEQSQESVNKIREQTSSLRKALLEHRTRMTDAEADHVKQLRSDRVRAESALKTALLQIELLERAKREDDERVQTLNKVVNNLQQSNAEAAQSIVEHQTAQQRLQTTVAEQSELVSAMKVQHAQTQEELHGWQSKFGELRVESQRKIEQLSATIDNLHAELSSRETNLRQLEVLLHEKEQTVQLLESLRSADIMSSNEEASAALRSAANQVGFVVASRDSCADDLHAVEQVLHTERQSHVAAQRQLEMKHAVEISELRAQLDDAARRMGALEMSLGTYREKHNVDGELLAESVERNAMLEAQVASLQTNIARLEKITAGRGAHNVSQGSQTTFAIRDGEELSEALNDRQSSLVLCEMQRAKLAEQNTLLSAQLRAARDAAEA